MPTVSIIIPVYNTEKYLRKCLDSIIAQSYEDFEAILVDDGSSDRSGKICDEYAKKDPRFIVVHKANEGVARARLTAFEHSNGELITFVDSDDIIAPDYLAILSLPILENGADMVSCDFSYKHDNGEFFIPKAKITGTFVGKEIKKFISKHFFYDMHIKDFGMTQFLCTKMVKKELVKDALIHGLGLWFGEDQIGTFHMLYNCNKLVLLPNRLYCYVRHDKNITQATNRFDESLWGSMIKLFEKYIEIDKYDIIKKGLRKRIFIYIKNTLFYKVAFSGITKEDFYKQMKTVRRLPFMKKYFTPCSARVGLKNEVIYWLLKLEKYSLIYKLMEIKNPALRNLK